MRKDYVTSWFKVRRNFNEMEESDLAKGSVANFALVF